MKKNIKNNGAIESIGAIFAIGIIICIIMGVFAGIDYMGAEKTYNTEVHSYVDQAYYVNDPVAIKDNLTKAVEGMHELGLTDNMYWKLFPWEQTSSESMKMQYAQMSAIITQCDQAIAMNNTDYSYTLLMTQIHNTIKTISAGETNPGNWCDEVAKGSYNLKFHPFSAWIIWVLVGIVISIFLVVMILDMIYG